MVNGLFTVDLDFGADAFNGNARWLEFAICPPTDVARPCTVLSPRQPLTPTPYAMQTRGIVVDADQRVGVGTKVPSERLSVAGSISVDESSHNNGGVESYALKFGGGSSGEGIASKRTSGANGYGLDFYSNFKPRMSITNSGYVGIATTAPQAHLHLGAGGDNYTLLLIDSGNVDAQYSAVDFHDRGTPVWGMGKDSSNDFYVDEAGVGRRLTVQRGTGNVGVGTNTPAATLDVRGDIKTGPSGQYFAAAGQENLRLLRGYVNGVSAQIEAGSGFTVSRLGTGHYRITYDTPFPGEPTVTANAIDESEPQIVTIDTGAGGSSIEIRIWSMIGVPVDSNFMFSVIGPR